MAQVVERVPDELQAEVDSALAFINAERGGAFRVTGIVDPAEALAQKSDEDGFDLSLVLCQGDLCLRERVRVRHRAGAIECTPGTSETANDPPALLDPPAGTRKGWLEEQRSKQAFIVLLFYRGFW